MKNTIAVSALLASVSLPSFAADLPARVSSPASLPVFASAPTWTGFYIGLQGGHIWGDGMTEDRNYNDEFDRGSSPSTNGVFGGAHLGYNLQFANRVVVGVEADIGRGPVRSSLSPTRTELGGALTDDLNHHRVSLEWFGSARARVGYALGNVLAYATGGVAVGETRYGFEHFNATGRIKSASVGWTSGVGLEYMIAPNWTTRAEYRYTDYGSASGHVFDNYPDFSHKGELKTNDVRIGVSYKFGG